MSPMHRPSSNMPIRNPTSATYPKIRQHMAQLAGLLRQLHPSAKSKCRPLELSQLVATS